MQTPARRDNAAGLAAIAYRAGTWNSFKESMLARLSSADFPALAPLRTRSDDDFVPAIIDATAMMLDVLTFYQERLANESYLRTAGQQRSLTELSRLIGYQPAPGVSASTYLAFSFKSTPGQPPPDPAAAPIVIPQGTQVQSVPAQGQSPQTFETAADIPAKPDWSALQVQTGVAWNPRRSGEIYLSGTTTQLQPGDSLLVLGEERDNWIDDKKTSHPSGQWDVVVINTVQADKIRNLTRVGLGAPLAHDSGAASDFTTTSTARVFAFRQKAALFGHNAPDASLFVKASNPLETSLPHLIDSKVSPWVWWGFHISLHGPISLDATYQKIVAQSWFALTTDATGKPAAQLLKVQQVSSASLSRYALSAKVTQLMPDYPDFTKFSKAFPLRQTEVWAQSDELQVAEQPLPYPLYGAVVALETRRTDLATVKMIALAGTRQKIAVGYKLSRALRFTPTVGKARNLKPGEILTLLAPPALPADANGDLPDWSVSKVRLPLSVADASGTDGTVAAELLDFTLAPSDPSDPEVSEFAQVASVDTASDPAHTNLRLSAPLANCYDRTTTTVNANVGPATHGQSVSEVLGSGAASTPDQTFALKQSPLTYVPAPTPTGRSSTLEVTVNGVDWTVVPTLSGQSGSSQVCTTLDQPGGSTTVLFGDGVEGALLPTGQNNVQASYRIGSGSAGNVGAGTLTTLVDRPLGVSGVFNPQAATGGQDPESVDDIRTNAPRTVLTLGRAVSITDYENFASSFAGIAKAHALWIPLGPGRGVFVTVAGAGGAVLSPGDPTFASLTAALQTYGNPLIPITAVSYIQTLFRFSATLAYDPAYDAPTVEATVRATLSDAFGFSARTFGQSVGIDEIASVIQGVPGIVATNVTGLKRGASTGGEAASPAGNANAKASPYAVYVALARPFATSADRLYASLPVPNSQSLPQPAEILVIDPVVADVQLSKMP
ncbi:putative baseplate assembly protein [Bradyrhizobium sp.]|uniref:putative baseplate assembly protein n=1 Tax=Bradyrhizobium sp. TaxID=376 RepID=UPI003C40AE4E